MNESSLITPIIAIRSAGEMATGIAWRLYMANMRRICLIDLDAPLCVRRTVSFCPALETGSVSVEGIKATAVRKSAEIRAAWRVGEVPVIRTDDWKAIDDITPDVVIDAVLAKRNVGTSIDDARLVVGLGPGFTAGVDCHYVIETNRGHRLGRVVEQGCAEANTGTPGDIAGYTEERVLRADREGKFTSSHSIGDLVAEGEMVGTVAGHPVRARVGGVLRGLIQSGVVASAGLKLGDVDPRWQQDNCFVISDKARALGGAVLEAILRRFNRPLLT